MAGIYSQGGSAGHRYAGWLSEVEAKNFIFGGKVFNGSPSAIYVGSNLVWLAYGLKDAAIRAILGAFGQRDGWAVINATNAYLNQLAASDRDKATALAGFINEDPMMVCSLGLEVEGVTMPERWMKADGNSYVDTGYKPNTNTKFDGKLKITSTGTGLGSVNITNTLLYGFGASGNTQTWTLAYRWTDGGNYYNRIYIGTDIKFGDYRYSFEWDKKNFVLKNSAGTTVNTYTFQDFTFQSADTLPLFAHKSDGVYTARNNIESTDAIFSENGVVVARLGAFKSATREGMVDVVNGTFHPNLGTGHFTYYYLRNGQPWTPSTP